MSDAEFLLGNDYDSAKKGVTSTMNWEEYLKRMVRPELVAREFGCASVYVNERLKHAGEILKARVLAVHGVPINEKDAKIIYDSTINRQEVTIRLICESGAVISKRMEYSQFKDASFVVQELDKLIKRALT